MYLYILASRRNGTLYAGVSANLVERVTRHREGKGSAFTSKYCVHMLVYYEQHETALAVITREKQIKKWNRAWKLELIESVNPEWRDLYDELTL